MAEKIAERLVWAVETLAVDPADHLLEIGCGSGVAVSLIFQQLAGGTITAIDRSEAMVNLARLRNHMYVASGKAVFHTVALEEADFGQQRFTKIFAFNVNLFWKQPATELRLIRALLAPGGALYLFHQPPVADQTPKIADTVTQILQDHHFSIRQVVLKDLKPAPALCLIAEASSDTT